MLWIVYQYGTSMHKSSFCLPGASLAGGSPGGDVTELKRHVLRPMLSVFHRLHHFHLPSFLTEYCSMARRGSDFSLACDQKGKGQQLHAYLQIWKGDCESQWIQGSVSPKFHYVSEPSIEYIQGTGACGILRLKGETPNHLMLGKLGDTFGQQLNQASNKPSYGFIRSVWFYLGHAPRNPPTMDGNVGRWKGSCR